MSDAEAPKRLFDPRTPKSPEDIRKAYEVLAQTPTPNYLACFMIEDGEGGWLVQGGPQMTAHGATAWVMGQLEGMKVYGKRMYGGVMELVGTHRTWAIACPPKMGLPEAQKRFTRFFSMKAKDDRTLWKRLADENISFRDKQWEMKHFPGGPR